MNELIEKFKEIVLIIERLRKECPWDREQTFESLRNYTIEEAFELSDAVFKKNSDEIKKELGDLLLHVIMYSEIAKETNMFELKDVIENLTKKLIYRHPHIFGEKEASNAKQVMENWEKIKLKEKGGNKTVLGGIPNTLPALLKAYRIQEKVSGVGFDWQKKKDVWDKVKEEVNELQKVMELNEKEKIFEEFGDVFFSLINAARLYDVHPEDALESTNQKFIRRFGFLEQKAMEKNKKVSELSFDEMNLIWEQSKKI